MPEAQFDAISIDLTLIVCGAEQSLQQQRYCDEVHERVARSAQWLVVEDKCDSKQFSVGQIF